ncbi:MAG: DNA glycosylase [Candidatus Didemnitutus sp.]|nr:DNA glycosylase [Candidatus Didemnitutus sp.]
MNAPAWSAWQPLAQWTPSPAVLAETIDGGQAFRWSRAEAGIYTGQWLDNVVELRWRDGVVSWRSPPAQHARAAQSLPRYLGGDTDWTQLTDALPWRSDAHLARCLAAFPGLRLLRQPFGETLLGFLCSATKQIPQIKHMLALLAERHGAPISPTCGSEGARRRHSLPTWAALACVPEAELRHCALGFRARYISETARFLAAHPTWLDETEAAPYALAKTRLISLPGVGEKVADCVLLFGAGKLEAFPVDTWILKALARRYGLDGWTPAQLAQFGRAHFGPHAGLAQQYLFSWERQYGRTISGAA